MVFFNKWVYMFRTTPDLTSYVEPLEDCLRLRLIPTLTGQSSVSNTIRSLLSLPARLGGLGIFDPTCMAESQYQNSIYILTPLISSLCSQDPSVPMSSILDEIRARKREVGSNNYNHTKNIASNLKASLTDTSLKQFGSHGREMCLNLAQCSAYTRTWFRFA